VNKSSPGVRGSWLLKVLRVPLFWKIVVANGLLLGILGVLALLLAPDPDTVGLWFPVGWTGVILVLVAVNGFLVHLALRPLRQMEVTAREVEAGNPSARVPSSPLADRELHRLTEVLNRMLDSIERVQHRHAHLSAQMARAEEAERSRLAGELFNDTAQILAAALLHLQLASRHLDPGDGKPPPPSQPGPRSGLESARNDVLSALAGIQRIARSLRPPELDELGPLAALEIQARRLSNETGIPVQVSGSIPPSALSSEAGLVLYRVLQEGVTNALLHGTPSSIRIHLQTDSASVRATLEDDGRGFDTQEIQADPEGRPGLQHMQDRASHVGGRLEVESRPGNGTRLILELPRKTESSPAHLRTSDP
jgi:two-component system, NarL family, sensor histidine kinase UhpB